MLWYRCVGTSAGSRQLLLNVVETPAQVLGIAQGCFAAIGMAGNAAMGAFDQLAVTARVVGDPDRRSWFGRWLGLDGDVLAAVVLALEADVVLGPQPLDQGDPFDQALDAVLVLESIQLAFDATT